MDDYTRQRDYNYGLSSHTNNDTHTSVKYLFVLKYGKVIYNSSCNSPVQNKKMWVVVSLCTDIATVKDIYVSPIFETREKAADHLEFLLSVFITDKEDLKRLCEKVPDGPIFLGSSHSWELRKLVTG